MNIFAKLPAGDSAVWSDDPVVLPDGRTADALTWTLHYALRGAVALDLLAVAVGAKWTTTLTATASAAITAGLYGWTAYLTNAGGERITVGNGQATITPNMVNVAAGYDTRSAAQKALTDCEAAMATFNATGGKVKRYDIAGRTLEFQSITDLMTLHSFWKAKVSAEQSASAMASGLGNPRNLYTRFQRPS